MPKASSINNSESNGFNRLMVQSSPCKMIYLGKSTFPFPSWEIRSSFLLPPCRRISASRGNLLWRVSSGHESFPTRWALRIENQILGTVSGYHGVTWKVNVQDYEQDIQKQPQISWHFYLFNFWKGGGECYDFFFQAVRKISCLLYFSHSHYLFPKTVVYFSSNCRKWDSIHSFLISLSG